MTISMDKQYRTAEREEARIYAIDGGGSHPVHGAIKIGDRWKAVEWTIEGRYSKYAPDKFDLIEAKPRIQREYWVNLYQKNYINPVLWETLDEAKQSIPYGFEPIARVKVVIDCEEGEGL